MLIGKIYLRFQENRKLIAYGRIEPVMQSHLGGKPWAISPRRFHFDEEKSEPLTFPIPEEGPGDGASTPSSGISWYEEEGRHPDLVEDEDVPTDDSPKNN